MSSISDKTWFSIDEYLMYQAMFVDPNEEVDEDYDPTEY